MWDNYRVVFVANVVVGVAASSAGVLTVVCSEDGVAILNASHRHGAVREAILQAFDLLEPNGKGFVPNR
jgi:hypothetical protein